MKRIFAGFLSLILCICIAGCAKPAAAPAPSSEPDTGSAGTEKTFFYEDEMPGMSFDLKQKDGSIVTLQDDDSFSGFFETHSRKVRYIDDAWFKVLGQEKVQNWVSDYQTAKKHGTVDRTYPALVKMLQDLKVSKEDCDRAVKMIQSTYPPADRLYISDQDLQVILSFDAAAINQHFVNEESICVNGVTYTGHWLANHSIPEYQQAGITIEMVEKLIDRYGSFIYMYNGLTNVYYNKYLEYQAIYDQPPYFDGYTMPLGTSWAFFRHKYPTKVGVLRDAWGAYFDKEKVEKWANDKFEYYEANKTDVMRDEPYPDAVQIILDLDIPIDIARKALKKQGQDNAMYYLTDEEIEILLSLDQTAIDKCFPGECTFFLNTRSYTLMWLLNHPVQEYMEKGITSTALEEALPAIEENLINGNYPNYTDVIRQKMNELKALEQQK